MNLDSIGLQLYTVRGETARDFLGTLRRVAGMGYRAVEFAGYGGIQPRELRSALDDYGLRALGAHVQINEFEARPEEVIQELKTLGCEYAVIPAVSEDRRSDANQVEQLAAAFNHLGGLCRDEGIQFGYHNHYWEFDPMDGSTMYYLLAEATDPSLVCLELDVFWAHYAHVDPLELLERYKGRTPLVHLKDMQEDGKSDAPVGAGVMPWAQILPAAESAGAKWYIVEQDNPQDPLEDVQTSFNNLTQMLDLPQPGEGGELDPLRQRSRKARGG